MLYNAHNRSVRVGNSEMDYVSFGNGNKNLIMLPGLGDGLSTVKGMAFVFSTPHERASQLGMKIRLVRGGQNLLH